MVEYLPLRVNVTGVNKIRCHTVLVAEFRTFQLSRQIDQLS